MSLRYLNRQGEIEIVADPRDRCRLLTESVAEIDGQRQPYAAWQTEQEIQIWWQGQVYVVPLPGTSRRSRAEESAGTGGLQLISQMPGTILNVSVTLGQMVEVGQPLILMESMKMEMSLEAPSTGRIAEILCEVGTRVDRGSLLIRLAEA